jgi:hypothetical protein
MRKLKDLAILSAQRLLSDDDRAMSLREGDTYDDTMIGCRRAFVALRPSSAAASSSHMHRSTGAQRPPTDGELCRRTLRDDSNILSHRAELV